MVTKSSVILDNIIRPMKPKDAMDVGRFYVKTFPEAIFAKLGVHFTAKFHRWLQQEPDTEIWVAEDSNGEISGIIAGTLDRPAAYSHAIRSHLLSVMQSLLANIWKPGVIMWIIRALWKTVKSPRGEQRAFARPTAELLLIVVREDAKGHGLARKLVQHMETAFQLWGFEGTYKIRTLSTNTRANNFYQRLGAHLAYQFPSQTFMVYEYHKELRANGK